MIRILDNLVMIICGSITYSKGLTWHEGPRTLLAKHKNTVHNNSSMRIEKALLTTIHKIWIIICICT